MSHIAIIGATGRAGGHLLEEALRRGHTVTAIARQVSERLSGRPDVSLRNLDVHDTVALRRALVGHHAVFSSVRFADVAPGIIIDAVKAAGVPRLLVVGGAASLYAAPDLKLIDTPNFPAGYKTEAAAGALFLDTLRAEPDLDWTFLSPSALFTEGPRTGRFRLGHEKLLVDAEGNSRISFADFAIAFLDELEQPAHRRQRFTVGY